MNDKAITLRGGGPDSPVDAHLWVCSGKNVGRRYRLEEAPQVLGRALSADIVVEDERASQSHAQVRGLDQGHIVEDLGSTNGTFVNNQRVEQAPLRDGDLLQIGETVFEYLSHEERTLSTTSRGTRPENDAVPDALRSGAQQMLRKVRSDQVEVVPPAPMPQTPAPPPGYPPAYGGHYPGYYDYDGENEDGDRDEGSGVDIIAIIARVREIVGIYVPYWPMALAFVFIGVMLGALHFRLFPPGKVGIFQIVLYESGTGASVLNPGGQGEGGVSYFGNQVVDRFASPVVVEQALEAVNGQPPKPLEVVDMSDELQFDRVGGMASNMYEGRLESETAEFAVRYLNTHLDLFLEREIEMSLGQVKADVRFFGEEVKKAARKLDEAEAALTGYKASNPDALPDAARSNYNLLFTLQQRRSTLERQIAALEGSRRENERSLARTKRLTTTSRTVGGGQFQVQLARVRGQIAAARASGKGDSHPDLIKLKGELAELEQLARDKKINRPTESLGVNTTYISLQSAIQSDSAKIRALKREMDQTERELENQRKRIQTLPKAEAEYSELAENWEDTQKEHSVLLRRLKNAQLQLERERVRADTQFSVVLPPREEIKPTGKKRLIRVGAGGIVGGFLAFALASLLLIRRGRLTLSLLLGRDIDLEAILGATAPGGAGAVGGNVPAALPAPAASNQPPPAALPPPPDRKDTAVRRGDEPTDVLARKGR